MEIIVVNDGSTDCTSTVVSQITPPKGITLKVIEQTQSGPSAARNAGLDLASGKYVLFLDSDDQVIPGSLSALLILAEESNSDATRANYTTVYQDGRERPGYLKIQKGFYHSPAEILEIRKTLMSGREQGFSCLWLIRRSRLGKIRFPTEFSYMEDVKYVLDVLAQSQRVLVSDLMLLRYVQSTDGLVRSPQRFERNLIESLRVHEQILEDAGMELNEASRAEIISSRIEQMGRTICIALEEKRIDQVSFIRICEKLQDDPAFNRLMSEPALPRTSFTRPMMEAIRRNMTFASWCLAVCLSYIWKLHKFTRNQINALSKKVENLKVSR